MWHSTGLLWGCHGNANLCLIPIFSENCLNPSELNGGPLSILCVLGVPYAGYMSFRSLVVLSALVLFMIFAAGNFDLTSCATRMRLWSGMGPKKSMLALSQTSSLSSWCPCSHVVYAVHSIYGMDAIHAVHAIHAIHANNALHAMPQINATHAIPNIHAIHANHTILVIQAIHANYSSLIQFMPCMQFIQFMKFMQFM